MRRAVEITNRERDGIVATVCKKRRAAAGAEADFHCLPGQCFGFGEEKGQAARRPRLRRLRARKPLRQPHIQPRRGAGGGLRRLLRLRRLSSDAQGGREWRAAAAQKAAGIMRDG
jgi:hypothetical protein